jgi:flagellar protein FlbD
MIHVTRINHASMVLNSDLIEHIETTPDTVISLTTGQKFMVLESTEEIVSKVAKFRRSICEGLSPCSWGTQVAVRPPEKAGEEGRS